MPTRLKQVILDDISSLCGTPRRLVGAGSTEPKLSLIDIVDVFGLPLSKSLSKPKLAQAIVELSGGSWEATFDSRLSPSGGGSTVTADGLEAVLKAVQRLATDAGTLAPQAKHPAELPGAPYRIADESPQSTPSEPFAVDPDAIDRASAAHARTQNSISKWARDNGMTPLSPGTGDPQFDSGWYLNDRFFVVEVKSLTGPREDGQMRLGIGQVLDYRRLIRTQTGKSCIAVLAVSRKPTSVRWLSLCRELGIELVWPAVFDQLPR